ncbi:NUDIX domain-containing protein [Streptomyces sp. CSDS2]|uniref:NUDIX domain-containing protein n=1 Tax=Streptomyces sp. CSDS2 TaxID=3055051 RepID=UPI0025B03EB6|nr:NUDIX domain-containing protein [Streptomyces sp. CSDS2]MDN3260511.1 NUDIX domain-containing protein [Streptomyces sp. CSDS2]
MAKVRVLFTDDRDRILLVRLKTPGQGLGWGLPGGTVEAGEETPREAAAREVAEELGLDRPAGRLLSVDWVNRPEDRPRTVQVFDGGRLGAGDLARIRLDEEELAEWRLCSSSEAEALLPAAPRGQLRQSLAVLAQGTGPVELVDGVLAGH